MEPVAQHIIDSVDTVVSVRMPTLKRVVFRRRYYGPLLPIHISRGQYKPIPRPYYEYRREIHAEDDGAQEFEVKRAYTPSGDYIGTPKNARYLVIKRGLSKLQRGHGESIQIGFSVPERKWYGWSHRAIYGFGLGSTMKPGDCGYVASTPEELFRSVTDPDEDGWAWQKPERVRIVDEPERRGIEITYPMTHATTRDEKGLLGGGVEDEPEIQFIACGRGSWTAETMKDAHQMACDFAEEVS